MTVTAGADISAAVNDYRRIQDALNAAVSGDTITLVGTFDFTAPFAAAAWALGNDGIANAIDDYEVLVPAGLSNVTITATSLGSATIQGPGDLPGVNLESFLIFDGALSGPNPGFTISNLRILDFDLSIGMFATTAVDYNNTTITNNFIRIPTDLNATVAPTDTNQNIGIHFSFGTNQSITGNTIEISGDGVSDSGMGNFSTSVGMQSNTSGGAVYEGLLIANNIIHVLNAQSGNPQVVLGIWENGHAHTSNINVTNNSFINDNVGNNPALNLQRAFRVTSHSSLTTTVTYNLNHADGANIGFQWLPNSSLSFAGNESVRLIDNEILNCDTGVIVQSAGTAHLETNVITGSGLGGGVFITDGGRLAGAGVMNTLGAFHNFVSGGSGDGIRVNSDAGTIAPLTENDLGGNAGFGLNNLTMPTILAEKNWWGNNLAANVAAEVNGPADFDPWLASGTDVAPATRGFQPFIFATTSGTITTFVGTPGADTGALLAGDPVTMVMSGQTAFTALAQLLNFDIQLGASDDVFTLGQTGVPTIFDGGTGNNTLVGTNVAQTWNVTGLGSGNIPGATSAFTNVTNLRAGTAADLFVFGAAGGLAGTLDGNLGIDTLNNSAIPASTVTPTGPGTLDGFKGTATGIALGFDNINLIAGAPADMSVTKTGPATANTSTVITYTITVINGGLNPGLNVQLTDTLPAGTTFVSLPPPAGWTCTTPAVNGTGTVTCSMASVPVGSTLFTLSVNAPSTAGSITNTATVTSANEGASGNESASVTTTINGLANLSVTKTGPATVATNGVISYTITVTNSGPSPALNVQLSDTVPAGTTFLSLVSPGGWICSTPPVNSGGLVTCSMASVPVGSSVFTLNLNAPAMPASITNIATVNSTNESAPGNESASAITSVNGDADLAITKTGTSAATTGGQIVYTITVTNNGPATATNVTVSDVLPAGVTFNSATPTQGSCSGTTTVTCNLGTLLNGATATISITVTVTATSGSIPNTATVSATQSDPTPVNASTTTTVIVVILATPTQVPTIGAWALLALILMLGLLALTRPQILAARRSSESTGRNS